MLQTIRKPLMLTFCNFDYECQIISFIIFVFDDMIDYGMQVFYISIVILVE